MASAPPHQAIRWLEPMHAWHRRYCSSVAPRASVREAARGNGGRCSRNDCLNFSPTITCRTIRPPRDLKSFGIFETLCAIQPRLTHLLHPSAYTKPCSLRYRHHLREQGRITMQHRSGVLSPIHRPLTHAGAGAHFKPANGESWDGLRAGNGARPRCFILRFSARQRSARAIQAQMCRQSPGLCSAINLLHCHHPDYHADQPACQCCHPVCEADFYCLARSFTSPATLNCHAAHRSPATDHEVYKRGPWNTLRIRTLTRLKSHSKGARPLQRYPAV